jgi:SAM-dependent methyltransferase
MPPRNLHTRQTSARNHKEIGGHTAASGRPLECVPCNLCDSQEAKLFAQTRDLYSPDVYTIFQCAKCGLIYVNPRPADYEKPYRKSAKLVQYYLDRETSDRSDFRLPLDLIVRYQPQGSLLDIGCGIGNFLCLARERSYKVTGIELNRPCVEYGRNERKLDIRNGTVEDLDPSYRFDVVTILSTLEHLGNPLRALKTVNQLLERNGILIVSIPNVDFLFFRMQHALGLHKRSNRLDPTGHLYYFSVKTLASLCEKAGLRVVYHESALVSSASPQGEVITRKLRGLLRRALFPLSNHFHWGWMVTVVCKKELTAGAAT